MAEFQDLRGQLKQILRTTSKHLTAAQISQLAALGFSYIPKKGKTHPKLVYHCNNRKYTFPIPGSGSDGNCGRLNWVSDVIKTLAGY